MTRTLCLLVLAMTCAVGAQARPDFSGVWMPMPVKPAAESTAGVVALPPPDLTVVQTTDAISLSRTAFDHVTTMTYTFDGKDNTNTSGAVTRVTRSHWNGAKFVTEGKASQVTSQGYAAWTLVETLHRDAQGRLVIDVESTASDGMVTKGSLSYTRKKTGL